MKKLILVLVVLVAFGSVALFSAGQQDTDKLWPRTQPVVTVGFGAGGGTDTSVRPVLAKMEEYLGETINVVNMEGAASALAAQEVLSRPADGYNFYATGSGPFSAFRVLETANVNWEDWYSWHAFQGPAVMTVRADSDIETLDDVFDAIENDDIIFGVSGFGVGPHVIMEAIMGLSGLDAKVNYMTSDSCRASGVDVISGDADVNMGTFSATVDFVRSGDLRPIVASSAETYVLGDIEIPSIVDVLPGAENIPHLQETWPFMIHRNAPEHIIEGVTEAFLWAMEQPEIVDYAAEMALDVAAFHGEEGDQFLSFSEAGYAWTIYEAGMAEKSPSEFDIPTMDEWDWEVERQKVN